VFKRKGISVAAQKLRVGMVGMLLWLSGVLSFGGIKRMRGDVRP